MRRSFTFIVPAATLVAAAGCASVFGIPSDVDERLLVDGGNAPAPTTPSTSEAGPSGGGEGGDPDTGPKPKKCDPGTPFGAPVKVTALNSEGPDGDARLTDDELTVYFSSRRMSAATSSLYTATRKTRSEPFANVILLAGADQGDNQSSPSPIVTGGKVTSLVYLSDKTGLQRADVSSGVLKPFATIAVNGALDVKLTPFLRSDRPNELWLASSSNPEITTELADIFFATSADGATFNAKIDDNVSTKGLNDYAPVISADGLSLYISRVRIPDMNGLRWFDILMARRDFRDDPFRDPVVLPPLRTSETATEDTYVTWISPDDCRIYFHRAISADGTQDIWTAERPLP